MAFLESFRWPDTLMPFGGASWVQTLAKEGRLDREACPQFRQQILWLMGDGARSFLAELEHEMDIHRPKEGIGCSWYTDERMHGVFVFAYPKEDVEYLVQFQRIVSTLLSHYPALKGVFIQSSFVGWCEVGEYADFGLTPEMVWHLTDEEHRRKLVAWFSKKEAKAPFEQEKTWFDFFCQHQAFLELNHEGWGKTLDRVLCHRSLPFVGYFMAWLQTTEHAMLGVQLWQRIMMRNDALEIAKLMIHAGVLVDVPDKADKEGLTGLHYAATRESADVLLLMLDFGDWTTPLAAFNPLEMLEKLSSLNLDMERREPYLVLKTLHDKRALEQSIPKGGSASKPWVQGRL